MHICFGNVTIYNPFGKSMKEYFSGKKLTEQINVNFDALIFSNDNGNNRNNIIILNLFSLLVKPFFFLLISKCLQGSPYEIHTILNIVYKRQKRLRRNNSLPTFLKMCSVRTFITSLNQ